MSCDVFSAIVASHAGQAPVFVNQLESRDVFESTPVKLECDVKGFPQPEITWFQVGHTHTHTYFPAVISMNGLVESKTIYEHSAGRIIMIL